MTTWTSRTKPLEVFTTHYRGDGTKWENLQAKTWLDMAGITWEDLAPTSFSKRTKPSTSFTPRTKHPSSWTSRTKP